jgi:hypothetical protein
LSNGKFKELAAQIGELLTKKNAAYGSSFEKCGDFLRLLYPDGISPEKYNDALLLVRIFDKQMRIATAKDAFGESPYLDIAGYGILGASTCTSQSQGEEHCHASASAVAAKS